MTGFKHEVKHFWNSEKTKAAVTKHLLGVTAAANIVDHVIPSGTTAPVMTVTDELNAADKFENRASLIPAPGIAPGSLWPTGKPSEIRAGWGKEIPGVKRCQEWTTELIEDLIKQGLLPKDALIIVQAARGA